MKIELPTSKLPLAQTIRGRRRDRWRRRLELRVQWQRQRRILEQIIAAGKEVLEAIACGETGID